MNQVNGGMFFAGGLVVSDISHPKEITETFRRHDEAGAFRNCFGVAVRQ